VNCGVELEEAGAPSVGLVAPEFEVGFEPVPEAEVVEVVLALDGVALALEGVVLALVGVGLAPVGVGLPLVGGVLELVGVVPALVPVVFVAEADGGEQVGSGPMGLVVPDGTSRSLPGSASSFTTDPSASRIAR
jgi:hypothetical protein